MPSPFKLKSFHMTPLDREMLDPDRGGLNDITWWYKAYFDGTLYPWQHYFYHHPAKDKMVVAGIRSGKSFVAAVGLTHTAFYHPFSRILNTSISSEQAKIVFHMRNHDDHDAIKGSSACIRHHPPSRWNPRTAVSTRAEHLSPPTDLELYSRRPTTGS